jgi:hypothetical protein
MKLLDLAPSLARASALRRTQARKTLTHYVSANLATERMSIPPHGYFSHLARLQARLEREKRRHEFWTRAQCERGG